MQSLQLLIYFIFPLENMRYHAIYSLSRKVFKLHKSFLQALILTENILLLSNGWVFIANISISFQSYNYLPTILDIFVNFDKVPVSCISCITRHMIIHTKSFYVKRKIIFVWSQLCHQNRQGKVQSLQRLSKRVEFRGKWMKYI